MFKVRYNELQSSVDGQIKKFFFDFVFVDSVVVQFTEIWDSSQQKDLHQFIHFLLRVGHLF